VPAPRPLIRGETSSDSRHPGYAGLPPPQGNSGNSSSSQISLDSEDKFINPRKRLRSERGQTDSSPEQTTTDTCTMPMHIDRPTGLDNALTRELVNRGSLLLFPAFDFCLTFVCPQYSSPTAILSGSSSINLPFPLPLVTIVFRHIFCMLSARWQHPFQSNPESARHPPDRRVSLLLKRPSR
jgi:hypothetical protein